LMGAGVFVCGAGSIKLIISSRCKTMVVFVPSLFALMNLRYIHFFKCHIR
jgi:hypothetical protein